LAAILLPVFATARERARQASCESNEKQIGLAIIQYAQDYDETFPQAFGSDPSSSWSGGDIWAQKVLPYIKSLNVFICPDDSAAGPITGGGSWEGWGISYALNSYYSPNWCCAPAWTTGFPLLGPSGISNSAANSGGTWLAGTANKLGTMTRPAETVLLTEKLSSDALNDPNLCCGSPKANATNFAPEGIIGGPDLNGSGWGSSAIPNKTVAAASWPNGPNGAVSAPHNGRANFLFLDGHVRSMNPPDTDPDPTNQPQNNMWDGTR
jgi:prepilin-type processing-associated H-X9-DG protein